MNITYFDLDIYYWKMFLICICSYFTVFRIKNYKKQILWTKLIDIFIITSIITYIKKITNTYYSIVILIFIFTILSFKICEYKTIKAIITSIVAISLNYIIFFIAIAFTYLVNRFYAIKNDYLNLTIIAIIYIFILIKISKLNRVKNGISFLNKNDSNYILSIIILNIGVSIMFSVIILSNMDNLLVSKSLMLAFICMSIIMIVTIIKSIEAYYKQKLLIQDFNETKKELDEKRNEIKELEAENLKISKKAHSLAHKQKSLEFKINKILMNSESAKEIGLEDELKNISNELIENSKLPRLNKTGISEIDDMFHVMQEECRLNGIDFVLQLKGNIYQMTNHYITKEELSILLADHIKDAIIAINHSDNINKSIMVRLGKIEDCFAVYFYDSGVEFPKEVLDNLGKKPITTYSDEGGTGMGFMNTFDLLNKYNASLIIEKIGSPCKDNYTKIIKIKFDNKKELII